MYPLSRIRQIRELSLFLFGGLPESPKPIFETDTQGFSEERTSCGRPSGPRIGAPQGEGPALAIARYDEDTKRFSIALLTRTGESERLNVRAAEE
jgi:hypothetical protein